MEKKDPKFYNELKQLNKDLLEYVTKTHEESPYYDFTPTFQDYIKQFKELEATTSVTPAAPAAPSFSFFNNTTTNTNNDKAPAAPAAPLFSFFNNTTNNNDMTPAAPLFSSLNNANTNNDTKTADNTNNDGTEAGGDDDAPPPEPQLDKFDEPDAKYSAKCKLYERSRADDGETILNFLGVGQLFIKPMDDPSKLQVIFRQDPDLRRVLMNEVLTSNYPIKSLPKAIQMVFPTSSGGLKYFIAKLKDEAEAHNLMEQLKF